MAATGPQFAYFEGKIVPIEQAKISVMTHALHYGTAAFGGIRAYWNARQEELYIFRPLDHFARLLNSARMLLIDVPYTPEQLRDTLVELLRREGYREDIYIRPLIYKSAAGIGVRLHDLSSEITMYALPFGRYIEEEEGMSLGTSTWRRVDDTMIPARGKIAGAYANSALIKTEAHNNGYDDGLVLSQDGHVSEASAANFFMIRKGVAVTPPVSANILEGITRQTVFTLLREQLGVEIVERDIDRTEVYIADEAFLCGTGVQIAAATSIDRRPIGTGRMGPVVRRLRELYFDVVRGNLPQYAAWNQPVYASQTVQAK